MSHNNETDLVEQAKERLLDPFEPIFPLPGMWYAIACYLCTLLAFSGFFISIIYHFQLHPGAEFFLSVGSSLFPIFFFIMISRGHAWAASGMRFLMYAPFSAVVADFYFAGTVEGTTLVFSAFAICAILISASLKYRGFVNIFAVRRAKILRMKQDGTYKQKLEEARKRWR